MSAADASGKGDARGPGLQFPYMAWAHTESFLSPYCLSQSGMPTADAALFEGLAIDPGHAGVDALPALEARLAELFDVPAARVLATVGASGAMLLCALRWFRPGARVVADVPSYEPFRALPRYLGAEIALVERRLEEGWSVDPERFAAALRGASGPGHVFVSNPHNPTGALHGAEHSIALAEIAQRAGGVLVSCEAYMEFLPNAQRVHAFALAPNALSIGTLTKAYGLGGLRVGWIVLGEGLARERAHLQDMAYLAYIDPPTPSLVAARHALDHLPRLLQPLRRIEVESRPHWERWLQNCAEIESTIPAHGLIAFPRVRGVDDTRALAKYLQREHQVDVVPGESFGRAGHVRVACGVPEATLVAGLERLTHGIAAFRARARA